LPDAIEEIKAFGTTVTETQADLSTTEGVENLWGRVPAVAIEHSPIGARVLIPITESQRYARIDHKRLVG
jgi:hypothetical protein